MEENEKKELALQIIDRLKKAYPDADCTLDYDDAWKLLVSVRLAAQCTDARVNVVVEGLYKKYPDVRSIYACGPKPMLRAIKAYAEEKGIECYLSMEERMACGIGACLACVCQSKEKDEHSQVHNKRVCKDGPVFLSTEVEL